MAWITGIAVLLALGRWLIRDEISDRHTPGIWEMVGVFVVLTGFNVLLALPAIWATLVHRRTLAWIAVAVLLAAGLTWAEPVLFERVVGGPGDEEVFWWFTGVHFFWVLCTLGLIPLCGYRFQRRMTAE